MIFPILPFSGLCWTEVMPLEWDLLLGFDKTFISIFATYDIGVIDVAACHTIGQIYLQPKVDLNNLGS